MMRLTLRLRGVPPFRVDIGALHPERIGDRSAAEVARIPLLLGNRWVPAGELFDVSGHAQSQPELIIEDSCNRLDGIAAEQRAGRVEVYGGVGAFLARDMRGGEVLVHGSCGVHAASGMRKGTVCIQSNAGDFLGAALPGQAHGLRGGLVVVKGNAGERVGDRMRRGMILVDGDVGAYCASRMIAGTISVLGSVGIVPGLAMRRGTVLLTSEPTQLPATFNDGGVQEPVFLALLQRALNSSLTQEHARSGRRVRRWLGDRAVGGQGEILIRQ